MVTVVNIITSFVECHTRSDRDPVVASTEMNTVQLLQRNVFGVSLKSDKMSAS